MSQISKLFRDARGIATVSGPGTALRWLGAAAVAAPQVLKRRNLLPADARMGEGPFAVRHRLGSAKLAGRGSFSGMREIWVRDCYTRGTDILNVPDNALIVDLGSNIGNFTMLALAANPTARVIAVEAGKDLAKTLESTAKLNGFGDRVTVCRALIGKVTKVQESMLDSSRYDDVKMVSEAEFLSRYAIERIDFLKCDIEGSEFAFLDPDSRLIDLADRIAIEIHGGAGDAHAFIAALEAKGFTMVDVVWDGDDCIALAKRR